MLEKLVLVLNYWDIKKKEGFTQLFSSEIVTSDFHIKFI